MACRGRSAEQRPYGALLVQVLSGCSSDLTCQPANVVHYWCWVWQVHPFLKMLCWWAGPPLMCPWLRCWRMHLNY